MKLIIENKITRKEAIQWDCKPETFEEIKSFSNDEIIRGLQEELVIKTLEGDMCANYKDFIIKGLRGEFYPCKPDIFEKSYNIIDSL